MLMEMIQPKVGEIEKKFTSGEGLTQEDINTLLLKSQYNHINHLDQKLNEVTADVASLKGEFEGLKGEFRLLETRVNERLNVFEAKLDQFESKMEQFEANISLKISEAINTNMRFSIGLIALIVTVLKLADMFLK